MRPTLALRWPPARVATVAAGIVALLSAPLAAQPRVVASILPVHALVSEVMEGVAEPVLLVPPGSSPHGYQMRPSDALALRNADLIVWVGEPLETFLVRPLAALGGDARVVELLTVPDMRLLPARHGGVWNVAHDLGHGHAHGTVDPHIWLSPANAMTIVDAVAAALTEIDPDNAAAYTGNAAMAGKELRALDEELRQILDPVRDRPFVVAHDAYQYLEQAFGLVAAGAITVSPDRPPGARRLGELRRMIADRGTVCVFTEPQFRTELAETLIEGTSLATATLDPEGTASWRSGDGTYLAMMRWNARALADCLARGS